MTSEFAEIHDELRAVARDLLGKAGTDVGWRQIADAGWTGLEIPEPLGGAGASFVESAIVLEELGRAAARTPYLGTVLAVGALTALPPNGTRDALLERIGSGPPPRSRRASPSGRRRVGQGRVRAGRHGAEVVLLLADDDGTPVVVIAPESSVTPQPVSTKPARCPSWRPMARQYPNHGHWPWPWRAARRAAVAVACDSLGAAEAMLSATVDYVKVRHQFGRPIGSFQAVKHACADMLVQTSVARQLVNAAVAKVAEGADASVAAAMAKSYACGAAVDVVGKAMQLHGGIGYTWESGVHVFLKRAALNRSLFGSAAAHRRRLAARYV